MINLLDAPTISMNDQAPGGLSIDNDNFEWNGPMAWNVRHGETGRSLWVAGKMVEMEGVSVPGLAETVSLKPGDPQNNTWRHLADDGKTWIHGKVAISGDGLLFIEGKHPEYKWKQGTLPGELHRSAQLIHAVDDFAFAGDIYGALCSLGWQNEDTGKQYWGSWRAAAEVVVSMRGRHESYTDFFLMGNEGVLTVEVRDLFESLGWVCIGRTDVEGRRRRAVNILETCEARPIGDAPEWYRHWSTGFVIGENMGNRMHVCAASGRASLDEWNSFWEYLLDDLSD